MRNRLGLHRRVHDYRVQALPLQHARRHRRIDAVLQQPLATVLADALPPAHQARRVAGQLLPEVALAAEVLPVGVLDPAPTYSSDSAKVCFRYSSDAINRVGSAGRPVVDSNLGPHAFSKAGQSIR
jgi:hypothetical protein